MVVDDEQLYRREALQKASDSTIKRSNMATALAELYVPKGAAIDCGADRMPKDVKKYAEMSDQKIRDQYKREAEAEASIGVYDNTRLAKQEKKMSTRSSKKPPVAAAATKPTKQKTAKNPKPIKKMKQEVQEGSTFWHDDDGLRYTVVSVDKSKVRAKSATTDYDFNLPYVRKRML
jgi:hypothetical protein